MSNFQTSKDNTVSSHFPQRKTIEGDIKMHGLSIYLIDNLDNETEMKRFQTCLRTWFVAYTGQLEMEQLAEKNYDIEPQTFLYKLIDDLFDSAISLAYKTKGSAECSVERMKIVDTLFSYIEVNLTLNKNYLRDWFLFFLENANSKFDNFDSECHSFVFAAINELFYAQMYRLSKPVDQTL